MKNIVSDGVTFGPFIFIQELSDRYIADGCEIPFTILKSYSVVDTPDIANKTVPQEVTMRQARLALLDAGLLSSVQTAINSLQEPAKTKAQIEWDYSNALQRDNSFVSVLGSALGLNEAALDNLFIAASKL